MTDRHDRDGAVLRADLIALLDGLAVGVPRTANAFTHPEIRCLCVGDHNPNPITWHGHHIHPLGLKGPDVPSNLLWLCPTTHANVHHLLRAWVKADGQPDWSICRRFGRYPLEVAELGFQRWVEAGRPT